jgi:hypothetical protein
MIWRRRPWINESGGSWKDITVDMWLNRTVQYIRWTPKGKKHTYRIHSQMVGCATAERKKAANIFGLVHPKSVVCAWITNSYSSSFTLSQSMNKPNSDKARVASRNYTLHETMDSRLSSTLGVMRPSVISFRHISSDSGSHSGPGRAPIFVTTVRVGALVISSGITWRSHRPGTTSLVA